MPVDEAWLTEWFHKLDQASRQNAITELRADQEKVVVEVNRELTEGIRQFSRLILEIWALKDAGNVANEAVMDQMYQQARALESRTRDLEDRLEIERRKFEAFEEMERVINRMR